MNPDDEKHNKKFLNKVIDSVFKIFHVVLETKSLSENLAIFLLVVSYLQIIAMSCT